MTTLYRKGKFSIDDSPLFEGYTNGHLWNGWACPVFTHNQVTSVLQRFCGSHLTPEQFAKEHATYHRDAWTFDPSTDTILTFNPDDVIPDGNCDGILSFKPITIRTAAGNVKVFEIGTGCWTWDEDEQDLPCYLVRVDFFPDPGESIYDYPFKEHKASKEEQITVQRSELQVVFQDEYEAMLESLPAYAGRRGARYQIKVLAEELSEDQILRLIGSCQACLDVKRRK